MSTLAQAHHSNQCATLFDTMKYMAPTSSSPRSNHVTWVSNRRLDGHRSMPVNARNQSLWRDVVRDARVWLLQHSQPQQQPLVSTTKHVVNESWVELPTSTAHRRKSQHEPTTSQHQSHTRSRAINSLWPHVIMDLPHDGHGADARDEDVREEPA
jgi:hypothetical protein